MCQLGAEEPRDLNITAGRVGERCQARWLSKRPVWGLEETREVWKGAEEVKKLKGKVTARNRRDQAIFVSEVSCGRHEETQPTDTHLLTLRPFPLKLA